MTVTVLLSQSVTSGARKLADDVVWLRSSPFSTNVYLVGSTLIDAGTRRGATKILRQLEGHDVSSVALTHVHPPTHGAVPSLRSARHVTVEVGRNDVAVARSGETAKAQPRHWFNPVQQRLFAGLGHPVDVELRDGDQVEDFDVLEVPGHSAGHVAFWRSGDGVLILGDVVTNASVFTGLPGLREPPTMFTPDPARNRESARRLAELNPTLICFGHGRPLRDADRFRAFVERISEGR
jgi:glyoxylase-like metal-dependent hydrolase (beta-lactamase superfamily II)